MNQLTLVIIKNPFDIERDRVVRRLAFVPGQPVFDYLRGSYPAEPDELDIIHNGRILEEAEYGRTTAGPDDFIVALPRVAKGSTKSKNILSMVASIGFMMLSMGVGNLIARQGFFAGGMASWTSATSYAAALAVNVVGGIAMSHWFPPPKLDTKQESPTYGWNGIQNQVGQGNPVQITFGTVRTGGQLLQSHVSVDGDKQYLNLLYCGGEGPCDFDGDGEFNPDDTSDPTDHVPGIANIQINGNPIENYSGVQIYKRAGLNGQSAIPGFADAYVEQALTFTLTENYAMATTTGDNVQGLEVALDFPTGLYRTDSKGSVQSGEFKAEIGYRLHDPSGNNPWQTQTCTVTNSTRMPFKNIQTIDHLTSPGQYDVRMKLLSKPDPDLVIQWSNLAQIIYDDFVRPNKILLGIKALATDQLSGGLPTVTWEQTRSKVWVWNPRSAAEDRYEARDATNPAWACHWLIHRLYRLTDGNGVRRDVVRGVPADRIDYDTFAEWADYCDGIRLDDPASGTVPARQLRVNLVLDSAQNLWEALRLIAPLGRGNVFLKGTRYSCVCDQPGQPVVQLFNMANIALNSFSEQFADIKDRANAIEVTFFNKEKDYQRDTITVYGPDYDSAATVQNPTQVTLQGCVTLAQAYRHGRYLLRTSRYNTRTCSWSADADSIACTIGDVVAVQHDVPLWGSGGRIVAADSGGVTLDRPVRLETGQSYALKIRLADDTLVDKMVVNSCPADESFVETATLQIITSFDAVPAAGDLYTFGPVQKVAKPFKILSITKDHLNQRRKITALEYNAAVYDESGDEAPEFNYSSDRVSLDGLIASHHTDAVGSIWLDIAWTPPRGMYYGVQIECNGSKVKQVDPPQTTFSWEVGTPGLYTIRVAVLDRFGNPCGAATLSHTATAQPAPADVSDLQLAENTYLLRDGTALSDIRVSFKPSGEVIKEYHVYYSLDEGGGWNFAGSSPDPAYTIKAIPNTQAITVKVCAVDRLGNESAGTCSAPFHLTGKSDPPSDVASLAAVQDEYNRAQAILSWPAIDPAANPDLRGYEIRVGSAWESGAKIGGLTTDLTATYLVPVSGNYTFWVKAVDNSGNYSVNATGKALYVEAKPNAPTVKSAIQDPSDRTYALLSWNGIVDKDLAAYDVRLGNDWNNGQVIASTKETSCRWKLEGSGSYNFMICARNNAGFASAILNIPFVAAIEAPDVEEFTVQQQEADRSRLRFSWKGSGAPDIAYYEIREGESWDAGRVLGTGIVGLFYDAVIDSETMQCFWIKAFSVGGQPSQNPQKVEANFNLNPENPTGLSAIQDPADRALVKISWDAVPKLDINQYLVKVGDAWDSAVEIAKTKELTVTWMPAASGDYKFLLKAQSNNGYYSDEIDCHLYVTLEPADVTGFGAAQNGANALLNWDKSPDSDVVGYEIREGAQFDGGTLVATGITGTLHQAPVDTETTRRYHIKAINRSGHYSLNAATATVTISNLPPKNVIESYDELQLRSGTHSNTEFGQSLINFSNFGGKFSDYPNTRFSDVGGQTVLKLKAVNGQYPSSGSYACARKDMGEVITANIGSQFVSSVLLRSGVSAKLQYRISRDGTAWTDWQDFVPVQATFRYLDFRVLLATADPARTPEVNILDITVDVPDVDRYGTADVAIGGSDIPYGHKYRSNPTVLPTAVGLGLRAELSLPDAAPYDHFRVRVLNASGQDVGGKVTWLSRGF